MSLLPSAVCLLLVTAVFSAQIDFKEVQQWVEECSESTNTPKEQYENGRVLLEEPSENLQCMAKCMLEKGKVVNDDGTFANDVINEMVKEAPKEIQSKIVECADDIKTVTKCEDTEKIRLCLLPVIKKVFGM